MIPDYKGEIDFLKFRRTKAEQKIQFIDENIKTFERNVSELQSEIKNYWDWGMTDHPEVLNLVNLLRNLQQIIDNEHLYKLRYLAFISQMNMEISRLEIMQNSDGRAGDGVVIPTYNVDWDPPNESGPVRFVPADSDSGSDGMNFES